MPGPTLRLGQAVFGVAPWAGISVFQAVDSKCQFTIMDGRDFALGADPLETGVAGGHMVGDFFHADASRQQDDVISVAQRFTIVSGQDFRKSGENSWHR